MKTAGRILVLDDEPAICDIVTRCLKPGGYTVQAVHTGDDLRQLLRRDSFDLVVLDLNLRGEDGLTLLIEIVREHGVRTIILTGRGEPVDRVVGLEMGADDYVPKPFEPRELLARVRSVLRRSQKVERTLKLPAEPVFYFGEFSLNPDSRQLVGHNGTPISLTTTEFDILHVMVTHPSRVLTRTQLMTLAHNKDGTPFDRSIDVHIGHLRRKLERDPKEPEIIKTVHGVGYIFATHVERRADRI